MREKLLDLMKSEGLKPSQLAEMLEINPAGISHILAGRNKPSFELLQKILRRFPRINPDWLLLDSKQMYRNGCGTDGQTGDPSGINPGQARPKIEAAADYGLFGNDTFGNRMGASGPDTTARTTEVQRDGRTAASGTAAATGATGGVNSGSGLAPDTVGTRGRAAVQRIVIFYDDQTFECYFPTRR